MTLPLAPAASFGLNYSASVQKRCQYPEAVFLDQPLATALSKPQLRMQALYTAILGKRLGAGHKPGLHFSNSEALQPTQRVFPNKQLHAELQADPDTEKTQGWRPLVQCNTALRTKQRHREAREIKVRGPRGITATPRFLLTLLSIGF